ncbi:MAG TPA: hypothetical protein VJ997_12560, partial [Longimicrobiales bacterium]|nr:hypothetical protein [Longimicrobiales bacterium]
AFASDYTLVEATEHGWWYAARLPRNRLIVSFTSDPGTLRRERLHSAGRWAEALAGGTRLVGPAVGDALAAGVPALVTRAAPVMILSAVVGPGWMAVGDAASCWDPLGSAGITKALMHGVAAGEAIADGLDSGFPTGLAAYQDRVFADFTEHVKLRYRLYGSELRWPGSGFWAARGAPGTGRPRGGAAD